MKLKRRFPSRPAVPPFMRGWSPNTGLSDFAKLPIEIDIASEFRYRGAPLEPGDLAIFISQSGETADTLATCAMPGKTGAILSIVNVPTSTIARESDVGCRWAGPGDGVASTKAFTCQLSALACLALRLAGARGTLSEE